MLSCSGGIGQIDHRHLEKADGEIGMLVVKIGGPAYRIGMGGGAASSVPSGSNKADLDFNAVQVRDGGCGKRLGREELLCQQLGLGMGSSLQLGEADVHKMPPPVQQNSACCPYS